MTEYHFYNAYHYGDTILNITFLNNVVKYCNRIEKTIIIYYYYNQNYNKNKREFEVYLDTCQMVLRPIEETPVGATHLWIGQYPKLDGIPYDIFDVYYSLYYKNVLRIMRLENHVEIGTSLYQDNPNMLDRYQALPDTYKNVDILILNTPPQSGQTTYDKSSWDEMCYFLGLKHKIVTAQHVHPDIPCTMRDGLTMYDIGAISTHCKYIIGVHSGPMTACYTSYTKKHVKKWFVFCDTIRHAEIDVADQCTMPQIYSHFRTF